MTPHVTALYRYPVKSMLGESLPSANIIYTGLEGDRRYAFLRLHNRSRFPWLTGREVPEMLTFQAEFNNPAEPRTSSVSIRTPDGDVIPLESADLRADLEQRAGEPVHLLHLGKGTHDSVTLSLMTTSTLRTLSAHANIPLVPARFRPNILVDTGDMEGFPEDDWVGKTLVFGDRPDSAQIHIVRPIERCMMINLDPETNRQTPEVLRAVVKYHQENAGVHATPQKIGAIHLGDPLHIL